MHKLDWAFLCEYANIDAEGRPTMVNVFERLTVKAIPAVHECPFYVLARFSAEAGDSFDTQIRLVDVDGEQLSSSITLASRRAANRNRRHIRVCFYSTAFTRAGKHAVELLTDGTVIHTMPFEVAVKQG